MSRLGARVETRLGSGYVVLLSYKEGINGLTHRSIFMYAASWEAPPRTKATAQTLSNLRVSTTLPDPEGLKGRTPATLTSEASSVCDVVVSSRHTCANKHTTHKYTRTCLQHDTHDPTPLHLSKLMSTLHSLLGSLSTGTVSWLCQVSSAGISCVLEP